MAVANARAEAVAALEARIGHRFADRALLERALTHSSVGQGQKPVQDNQRLEFLGDRVLGLFAAEHLLEADPEAPEGTLTPRLHALTDGEACARVAERIGLGEALRLAPGETRHGARRNRSILGDAMEALVAALYLETGPEATRAIWRTLWAEEFSRPADPRRQNPKSMLQEWAQGLGRPLPAYVVVEATGPDHAPTFTVEAVVEGFPPARGVGPSRQAAEKAAAETLLEREAPDDR